MRYDTVIVGGGTSGCVVAARLSENPERSVLLIEAGPVPRNPPETHNDAVNGTSLRAAHPSSPLTWHYPARLTASRSAAVVRGKILGGSSAINGGYFIRPRPEDFDHWASVGGSAWSYDHALPLLRRLETDLDFAHHAQHGSSGPMLIRRPWTTDPTGGLDSVFATAAEAAGHPCSSDLNGTASFGFGSIPTTMVDGIRRSAAMQYLLPILDRPNLKVLGKTRVLSVKINQGRAVGVDCANAAEGTSQFIPAGEVVLAAGALSTPQLLMLSGAGDPDDLRAVGVRPAIDAPGVGRGLSDHPDITLNLEVSQDALPAITRNHQPGPAFSTALHFPAERTGTKNALELLITSTPNHKLFGSEAPQHGTQEHLLMLGLMSPASRGSLRLRTADPFESPFIDYNYLDAAGDQTALRAGLREILHLLTDSAMQEVFVSLPRLSGDMPNEEVLDDDDLLNRWISDHIGTRFHTSGGARIGPVDDPESVVNQRGQVHQVQCLRVADLSLLPSVPCRGTANTSVFIGELISDFMT